MDLFDVFTPSEILLIEECLKNESSRLKTLLSDINNSNSENKEKIEKALLSRIEKINIMLEKIK